MLGDANVQPMLPVKDLGTAGEFYGEKLGLRRVDGAPGAADVYRSGNGTLCVYRSEFAGTNKGTAALWEVGDVERTVEELKARGVTFERYDNLPAVYRTGDIHHAGDLEIAWFKDPDGNILSIQNRPAKPGQSQARL
jgi:catechol 2,3-dioxygenase-like lactoylglutathione lyase family enzyme